MQYSFVSLSLSISPQYRFLISEIVYVYYFKILIFKRVKGCTVFFFCRGSIQFPISFYFHSLPSPEPFTPFFSHFLFLLYLFVFAFSLFSQTFFYWYFSEFISRLLMITLLLIFLCLVPKPSNLVFLLFSHFFCLR